MDSVIMSSSLFLAIVFANDLRLLIGVMLLLRKTGVSNCLADRGRVWKGGVYEKQGDGGSYISGGDGAGCISHRICFFIFKNDPPP